MLCPECYNHKMVRVMGTPVPCPSCFGQEPSCCEGSERTLHQGDSLLWNRGAPALIGHNSRVMRAPDGDPNTRRVHGPRER